MILPAAGLDGLQFLDVQQPGPFINHLLKMAQGQPLPGPIVNENVPLLPVPHIVPQHLAGIAGQLHGLGHVAPGQAVVPGSVLGKVISPVLRFHSSILASRTSLGLAGTIVFALFASFAVH